jgi:hypothetical protein
VSDGDLGAMLATNVTPGLPKAEKTDLEGDAELDWPESLDESDEAATGVLTPGNAPAGLSWPEEPDEADEAAAGLPEAEEAPDELAGDELAPLAADEGDETGPGVLTPGSEVAGLDWLEEPEVGDGPVELAPVLAIGLVDPTLLWQGSGNEAATDDVEAWPISLLDDEALTDLALSKQSRRRSPGSRRRRVSFTPDARQRGVAVSKSVSDDEGGAGLPEAEDVPAELAGDELAPLASEDGAAGLPEAEEAPEELAGDELAPWRLTRAMKFRAGLPTWP